MINTFNPKVFIEFSIMTEISKKRIRNFRIFCTWPNYQNDNFHHSQPIWLILEYVVCICKWHKLGMFEECTSNSTEIAAPWPSWAVTQQHPSRTMKLVLFYRLSFGLVMITPLASTIKDLRGPKPHSDTKQMWIARENRNARLVFPVATHTP